MNTEIAKLISRHCSIKETYEKYVDTMKKVDAVYNPDANLQEILDYEENIKNAIKQKTGYASRLWWNVMLGKKITKSSEIN